MEKIEKFTNLLKGKLDETTEKELFSELAADDELRSEFKSFASVTNSIKTSSFAPSTAVKSRIFAKAGMTMPAAVPANNATKAGLLRKPLFTSLLTGVATTITTIAIMLFILKPGVEYVQSQQASITKNNKITKQQQASREQKNQSAFEVTKQSEPEIRYIYVNRSNDEDKKQSDLNEKSGMGEEKLLSGTNFKPEYINNNSAMVNAGNKSTESTVPRTIFNGSLLKDVSTKELSALSLEVTGSTWWNFPKETRAPSSISKFNNLNIAALYAFSDHFKAGIDLQQENFYMEFKGTEPGGSLYRYMQSANFTTGGAFVRLQPFELGIISPYIQLGAGMNKSGYIASPVLGLELKAYRDLSFLFSFEYNRFWYQHQNQWYSTSKAGINYGISYKF